MPGRRASASRLPGSSTILTGIRCTTLVKLPVALSGGSSANSWPLAGAMLSTRPRNGWPGKVSTVDLDLLSGPDVGELGLLVVGDDIGRRNRHHRHQLRPRLDILADAQRAGADDAVDRRDDGRIGEVELGLALHRLVVGQRRLRLGKLGLHDVDLADRRLERRLVAGDGGAGARQSAKPPAGRSARCRSRWRRAEA